MMFVSLNQQREIKTKIMKAIRFYQTTEPGIYCFTALNCTRSHFFVKDDDYVVQSSIDKIEDSIDFIYNQKKSIVVGFKTPRSLRTKLKKLNLI